MQVPGECNSTGDGQSGTRGGRRRRLSASATGPMRRMARKATNSMGYDGLLRPAAWRAEPGRQGSAGPGLEQCWGSITGQYFGLERAAFPREAGRGARRSILELYLGQAGAAGRRGWWPGPATSAGCHRKRRPRRLVPGMLLHIDGSQHQWFQDERWHDLIVVLDDATSEIYYAQRGRGGIDVHGDGRSAPGHRAQEGHLHALYSDPRQPLLASPPRPAARSTGSG